MKKSYKSVFTYFIATCAFFYSHFALSLPAPMNESEMMKNSDVVADVHVLGIFENKNDITTYKDQPVSQYTAWLEILKSYKGQYKEKDTILYCWHSIPPAPFVGAWYVKVTENEKANIYLVWNEEKKCYNAISWNAKKPLK